LLGSGSWRSSGLVASMDQDRDAGPIRGAKERRAEVDSDGSDAAEEPAGGRGRIRKLGHPMRAHASREQQPGNLLLGPLFGARAETHGAHHADPSESGRRRVPARLARAREARDARARNAAAATDQERHGSERDKGRQDAQASVQGAAMSNGTG